MLWTVHMYNAPQRINYEAVAIGTNIFSFGGFCGCIDYTVFRPVLIHVLDTVKLKWLTPELNYEDIDSVPFQRFGHTVVALGSNIYLWGGRNIFRDCNTLYCFDTNTLKWSKPHVKGYIPVARDGHSACVVKNCMYIFGGFLQQPDELSSTIYKLDFKSMMWSKVLTTGSPPPCRDFHTATAIGDKMYIYGGSDDWHTPIESSSDDFCSLMFCLDTSTGTWTCPQTGGDSPIPRCSHSAFVYNGFIYIFGGFNKKRHLSLNDLNRYDPVNCTWTKILPMGTSPCSRKRQICQLINDKVFISGGNSTRSSYSPLNLKHYYDFHVLDMNPSLKDICMVRVWERFIEVNVDNIDDLCIPLSLKCELGTFNPIKLIENDDNEMQ